jgi:hypothetical protein
LEFEIEFIEDLIKDYDGIPNKTREHWDKKQMLEMKLEVLKEDARAENDRRVWLEVIKYQNKIKGGEIERSQIEVKGELNVKLSWGNELSPDFGQTEIL